MVVPSYVGSLRGKDFVNTQDFSQAQIKKILDAADDLRKKFRKRAPTPYLSGRTLFMIFYNRSLRTRNSFEAGVETHVIDKVPVRIYCPEKTLADCFKYRNKIGLDIAIETLRAYRGRRGARLQAVLEYSRICRVERVVRPYLEAIA